MSKKTYKLVVGCIGAAEALAVCLITYFEPSNAAAWNGAVVIAATAAIEICDLFVKEA